MDRQAWLSALNSIAAENFKYTIYWEACRSADVSNFHFSEYIAREFPEDYLKEFIDAVNRLGISVSSLPNEMTEVAKRKLFGHPKYESLAGLSLAKGS